MLDVGIRGKGSRLAARAVLNGEEIAPVATLEALWQGGRHSWPGEDDWALAGPHGWIVGALPHLPC